MNTISAIVPTFNRAELVGECIDSLLAQTRALHEIIVVDDGSADDTADVVSAYPSPVRLIRKPNGGKSSALNRALAEAKGDYVWICDDDDFAEPRGAERLAGLLDQDDGADYAFGSYMEFEGGPHGRQFFAPPYAPNPEEPDTFLRFLEGMFTFQFAFLVRRAAYERLGPFREDLPRSQDYEMTLRLTRACRGVYTPEVIFYQRRHMGVRGSTADRFSVGESAQRWLKYDQSFFRELREQLELVEFTPTFARTAPPPLAARAAHLQRAMIFARRAMWRDAADDVEEACRLDPSPAAPAEKRLAERAITPELPWRRLADDREVIQRLRRCAASSPFGADVVGALCRPIVWRTKAHLLQGRLSAAADEMRLMSAVLGPAGSLRRLGASALAGG